MSCAKCPNRVLRPLDDAAIYRHLAGRDAQGRDVIGLYPMLPDETCYLLALDFDDANWQDCARAVASVCRAHSIPFALERSRSGQGAHVWLFFAEAIPCAKARQLGDALLSAAMDACGGISFTAYDRMFPNQDTLRNDLIVQDARDLLAQGRTPLLLTERLEHAKILAATLRTFCPHVFLLSGRGTVKEKRAQLDELAAVPAGEPLAVVAIGKYAGEGFDLPRLDALLLTMPVVWKGTLTQYTGRLHRAAPGKREVLLYDYVDVRVPMLEQQYRRRLRSYAALAYTVRGSTAISNLDDHTAQKEAAIFVSCEQFSQQFTEDLEAASHEALFCVSSLSARPVQRMIPLLQRLQHKGGEVRIYLPEPAQFRGDIQPRITANAAALQRAGIPVVFCPNHLPNFCVIDQRLVWHGGLNPLGRTPTDESSLRMDAPDMATELVEFLRGMMPSG